jgi:hypothetical protein
MGGQGSGRYPKGSGGDKSLAGIGKHGGNNGDSIRQKEIITARKDKLDKLLSDKYDLSTFNKLTKDIPVNIIDKISDEGDLGQYNIAHKNIDITSNILLNENMKTLDDYSEVINKNESSSVGAEDFNTIYLHEVGHHLESGFNTAAPRIGDSNYNAYKSIKKEYNKTYMKLFGTEDEKDNSYLNELSSKVSKYAASSPTEFFSEVFTYRMLGGKLTGKLKPIEDYINFFVPRKK